MNRTRNTIWQKLKDRLHLELPTAYATSEWEAMESLLDANKKPIPNRNYIKTLRAITAIILSMTIGSAFYHFYQGPQLPLQEQLENKSTTIKQIASIDSKTIVKSKDDVWSKTNPHSKYMPSFKFIDKPFHKSVLEQSHAAQVSTIPKLNNDKTDTDNKVEKESPSFFITKKIPQKSDKLKYEPQLPDTEIHTYNPVKMRLGYHASIGYGLTLTDGLSKKLIGGLGTSLYLNKDWTFDLEGTFRIIDNFNQSYEFIDTIHYPNNANVISETISTRGTLTQLNLLDLTLAAKFHPKELTSYQLGFRYSRAVRYFTGELVSYTSHSKPVMAYWKDSYSIMFGVQKRLLPQISLDLRGHIGLLDITPDNVYNNTKGHYNHDLQITLKYHLK